MVFLLRFHKDSLLFGIWIKVSVFSASPVFCQVCTAWSAAGIVVASMH